MAKPKVAQDEPQITIDQEEEDYTPDDVAMQDHINSLTGTDNSVIAIHRVGKHGKDLTFIDEVPPTDFNLSMLKYPPYNGGTFRIYGKLNGRIAFGKILKIEAAPQQVPQQVALATNNDQILAAIREQGNNFQQALITAMQTIQKPESRTDFLKELMVMKELFAPPVPVQTPTTQAPQSNTMAMFKEFMELKKLLTDDSESGSESSPLMAMGMKLLEKIPAMMPNNQGPQPTEQIPQQAIPNSPIVMHPAPMVGFESTHIQTPPVAGENMENSMMLEMLIKAAKTNAENKRWWADAILNNAPDEVLDIIFENTSWWEELVRFDSRLSPYKAWFEGVRKIMFDLTDEAAHEGLTPESEGVKTGANPIVESPGNDPESPA